MKERPILFSAPMVRALLEGRKTQTRRAVKPKTVFAAITSGLIGGTGPAFPASPYGEPGDTLWVKETWAQVIRRPVSSEEAWWPGKMPWRGVGTRPTCRAPSNPEHHVVIYRADGPMPGGFPHPWKPSIFMCRLASRLTLELTEVRVERLRDISEEDAAAEGIEGLDMFSTTNPISSYRLLWESINGPGSWDLNPFVWAITFQQL